MFRWDDVSSVTLDGMTIKAYRDPLTYTKTQPVVNENFELDHYAYKYLDSEVLFYQILELNFTEFMEARGKTNRIKNLEIPLDVKEEVLI